MTTRIVEIHKANIPLLDGESLDTFQRVLRTDLQKKFGKAGGQDGKGRIYIWPRAVFSERVVFERNAPAVEMTGGMDKLMSVTFKRGENGSFEFGDPAPVREQVNFVPVSKSEGAEDEVEKLEVEVDKEIENFWSGVPIV